VFWTPASCPKTCAVPASTINNPKAMRINVDVFLSLTLIIKLLQHKPPGLGSARKMLQFPGEVPSLLCGLFKIKKR
jgi:hypothetical protein